MFDANNLNRFRCIGIKIRFINNHLGRQSERTPAMKNKRGRNGCKVKTELKRYIVRNPGQYINYIFTE